MFFTIIFKLNTHLFCVDKNDTHISRFAVMKKAPSP